MAFLTFPSKPCWQFPGPEAEMSGSPVTVLSQPSEEWAESPNTHFCLLRTGDTLGGLIGLERCD